MTEGADECDVLGGEAHHSSKYRLRAAAAARRFVTRARRTGAGGTSERSPSILTAPLVF